MTLKETVFKELDQIPEPALAEVLDFIRLLKAQAVRENGEFALLAESAWKDWLRPEEDEAWHDL